MEDEVADVLEHEMEDEVADSGASERGPDCSSL